MKKCAFGFLLSLLVSLHSAPPITQEAVELLRPKLNSDRIAYFFGSYGVEPIQVESSPFGSSSKPTTDSERPSNAHNGWTWPYGKASCIRSTAWTS